MIDRDAEIATMVDEYLVKTSRFGHAPTEKHSAAGRAAGHTAYARYWQARMGMKNTEIPPMPEDFVILPDETPAEDVERRGVIGTETE
ncbi:MAG TPA: hypothetical protein VN702_17845 [Acetobacteraceae bacterium]|nr:hypothetical protein [Acetobacteraceae bacterium]